jgi:serine/threonine-protein kinase
MCPKCLLSLAGIPLDLEATQQGVAGIGTRTAVAHSFAAGARVGDYELLSEIGRGGMGVVYEARHVDLKRRVALKVLPWAEFSSEEQRERFRREAEAAARLNHPHIVSVFEWGNHGGCPYMAMRLVEGARSLADEIAKGPLPAREAARILAKVARGVHYSHQHGVLHRDIKPGNILLDAGGEPLLVDFGLARLEDAAFNLTQPDLVFGTPAYMPPEQGAGEDITTASDVYSLGAVLYEALTGKPPFRGKSVPEIMRQVAEQEAPSPQTLRPDLDRDVATIVLKCLEKSPSRRYGSADALA